MGDINDNEPERFLTAADALELFKRLQIEERIRKDEERYGSELPLEISEYLDSTPTYEHKEEFTRFKKQSARYRNDNWNKQHQINKEIIPELKKWKTDTHQVVTSIYKYSENTRIQARATTEIYEQLRYLQGKIQFENPEDKEIFDGIIDQAAKLAMFGFGQAKFQDNDARDYATKALKLPASMQYKGKFPEEDRAENTFDQEFMTDLHQARFQQRLLYNNTNNNQQHGHLSVGIFTREGTDVGTASPLQSTIPTLPPTTINSNNFTVASTNITSTTTTETTTATASTYTTTSYSTELLNSSRWHPSRGPSDQFLPQLEETDTTPMAIETDKRRISDSVYINSKAMLFTKKICSSRRTKGNKYCNKQISNCRNNRKVYRPNSKRLPFKIFHPSRSNQEETHSGLSQNKPIYSGGTFQDGRGTSSERPHRTKRFHGKTRLTRRIHRITNPSKFKALLSIRKPRHNLPVQSSQLWTKCRSKDFFQNTSVCHRAFKKTRHKNGLLLGRYLHFITKPSRSSKNDPKGNNSLRILRLHNKHKKESINTISCSGILGFRVQHKEDANKGSRIKDPEVDAKNQAGDDAHHQDMSIDGGTTGENNSHDSSSRRGITSYTPHPEKPIEKSDNACIQLRRSLSYGSTIGGRHF
ncbi:hypothetical protein G6F47_005389 [Rhizopus delemar]|nr:hypothetical protein G6F49_011060 [Rhizopus delemar]KAG1579490.1 hypothetical protein G6F48_011119 [Rhizopus delemar]KAG1599580.1 hypothetical protein G6F47_005389 [Rhizopus delemar]KAG1639587.1 hypothetical protein G6F44_007684 [Rhizopus delemar]